MVAQIRARWPEVKITVRGDSGFCRDQIMRWCEDNGIWYVFGLSHNPRLQRKIRRQMSKAGSRRVMLGKASRRFRDFRYRTLAGCSCKRRVVAKAEWLPGPRGYNSRSVVTNIPKGDDPGEAPVRGSLLCTGRDGKPDQGAAAGSVCRPDLGDHDANQPAAGLLLGLRRCSDADHPPVRTAIHLDGAGPGRDHPHSAPEDRRIHQGDDAKDPGLLLHALPVA